MASETRPYWVCFNLRDLLPPAKAQSQADFDNALRFERQIFKETEYLISYHYKEA